MVRVKLGQKVVQLNNRPNNSNSNSNSNNAQKTGNNWKRHNYACSEITDEEIRNFMNTITHIEGISYKKQPRLIKLNGIVYNAETLSRWLEYSSTVPHSRRRLKPKEKREIEARSIGRSVKQKQ